MNGSLIYVAGNFTDIAGLGRKRIAVLDADGEAYAWDPRADSDVHAILLDPDGDHIYIGGAFSNIGSAKEKRFVKIEAP